MRFFQQFLYLIPLMLVVARAAPSPAQAEACEADAASDDIDLREIS